MIKIILILTFFFSLPVGRGQVWSPVGGGAGNDVRGLYVDTTNHLLYAVGSYFSMGGTPMNRVSVWDGTNWTGLCPFGPYLDSNPIINVTRHNGELIVSGQQSWMGTADICQYSSRLTSGGWEAFGNPNALSLIHKFGNELFMAGYFTEIDGLPIRNLARWTGTTWEAVGTTDIWNDINGGAVAAVVKHQGKYIAGGNFEIEGYKEIAQWDGNSWLPLGNGIPGEAGVECMTVFDDILYVGGWMYQGAGNPSDNLVAWDGQQWFNPFPQVHFFHIIRDLQVIDNELYIVGAFYLEGDSYTRYTLAKFDGDQFCAFGGTFTPSTFTDPQRIAKLDGTVYVASNKVLFGDTVNYIAQWNGTEMDTCIASPVHLNMTESTDNISKLYPTPVVSELTVETDAASDNTPFLLLDASGKTVLSGTIVSPKMYLSLDWLQRGVYFFKYGNNILKVVKQ